MAHDARCRVELIPKEIGVEQQFSDGGKCVTVESVEYRHGEIDRVV
ncbi:hypothetical protein AGR2A_Cc70049 [Agrobacterium genomosp. 2 str. CFBP 5494]|uniref:Uncharacterized protein n=1 Tax=Agrobacterium genomosp. 2 str. CFBP 5494 TaxID=1183436 RepID=A0A9W5B240_9HYPH|nr:hypothetical protein AGR2A_Cc70049 [Agrobacterium genomosp. 2 str. CFBP 5494]